MATQNYAHHTHNPKISGLAVLFFLIAAVAFALRWFYIGGR